MAARIDGSLHWRCQLRKIVRQLRSRGWSLIAAIGEQLFQERKHPEQVRHDQNAAIAILNIGRMDDGMKQQAQCVYKNMPLLTLDFFARIIAGRIDAGPPPAGGGTCTFAAGQPCLEAVGAVLSMTEPGRYKRPGPDRSGVDYQEYS